MTSRQSYCLIYRPPQRKDVWNLEGFDFHNEKISFPENLWCTENVTTANASVLFIIPFLFSLRLAVCVRQNQNHKVSYLFCTRV